MHKTVKILIALTFSVLTYPSIADVGQECRKIQDPALRLKCFDEAPAPAVPNPKSKPSAPKVAIPSDAGWHLEKTKDQMTDRTSCIVFPVNKRHVQFSPGHLYISYHGRGGVQGFRYRIDDGPPSEMKLPTPVEQQISAVHISGSTFNQILSAGRLRVEVLTVVSGLQNEDLQLAGMRRLYEKMIQECR